MADFSKSSWSDLLKVADLDNELRAGKPGRPQSVDENTKCGREVKTLIMKFVNETYDGDFKRALEVLKPALGNKAEYLRADEERSRDAPQDYPRRPGIIVQWFGELDRTIFWMLA